jgi:small subunit ribosomal protein S6
MDNTHRLYETTFIVNASLDDPQVDAVVTRVQDTITKNGGTVKALNKWGRKRLSYSINKKTNGYYVNVEFQSPAAAPNALERFYQLDEMILRHLTIAVDKRALKARAAVAAAAAAVVPADAPLPAREPLFTETPEERKKD